MGFRRSVTVCFQDYVTFSGRASRSEFWWFILFLVGAVIVLEVFDQAIFARDRLLGISGLFSLFTFLPQLAVSWRRMHDTGRPGWLNLIPIILFGLVLFCNVLFKGLIDPAQIAVLFILSNVAAFVILVLLAMPTQAGPNRYGPEPVE